MMDEMNYTAAELIRAVNNAKEQVELLKKHIKNGYEVAASTVALKENESFIQKTEEVLNSGTYPMMYRKNRRQAFVDVSKEDIEGNEFEVGVEPEKIAKEDIEDDDDTE